MTPAAIAAVAVAGFAAGAINAIVGSGSLLTFPTLLAVGYQPVVANVSNTVGIFVGTIGSVFGYRRELAGQRARILRLLVPALAGGTLGAALLLVLPQRAFKGIVPVLVALAVLLVVLQPWLTRRLGPHFTGPLAQRLLLPFAVFLTAIYGGYFGAAQGVILMSLLGIFLDDHLQRLNAAKNVLAFLANGVSALVFIFATHINWEAAVLIAAGSIVGGQLGGHLGRRIPAPLLRVLIIVVGVTAAVVLLVQM
ncbi:MAG TPA: sulfite exporter TauE/SafE family protein [Acidimicrobiales bacterium]|nr:sulfite exporter TauE/SafE family protein [Acidimicrobiales bacterium]